MIAEIRRLASDGHDVAAIRAEQLTTPDILAFAGIEPVTVAAIPLEHHVAEKLHAYTGTYEGSRLSTRAKDLVDLALIAELSPLKATLLRDAIENTFARREAHAVPGELPHTPADWRTPIPSTGANRRRPSPAR